jgi:hypothetical protein
MDATRSSKTLVDYQRTMWHYITEDRTLLYTITAFKCPEDGCEAEMCLSL